MISQDRYFITKDTRLATALIKNGVSQFLQIDQHRSNYNTVYLVLSNVEEATRYASESNIIFEKLKAEIDYFKNSTKPSTRSVRLDDGA